MQVAQLDDVVSGMPDGAKYGMDDVLQKLQLDPELAVISARRLACMCFLGTLHLATGGGFRFSCASPQVVLFGTSKSTKTCNIICVHVPN